MRRRGGGGARRQGRRCHRDARSRSSGRCAAPRNVGRGDAAAEAAPASPAPVVTEKPKPKKEKAGKSTVTFKTGDFTFVWVKVKGKVLPLEPIQRVELPAGRHRVPSIIVRDHQVGDRSQVRTLELC